MNYRQHKKQVFHKRKKHGYWKEYKKKLRKFFAEHPCRISGSEYPKRKRIRQFKKYHDYLESKRMRKYDCL